MGCLNLVSVVRLEDKGEIQGVIMEIKKKKRTEPAQNLVDLFKYRYMILCVGKEKKDNTHSRCVRKEENRVITRFPVECTEIKE